MNLSCLFHRWAAGRNSDGDDAGLTPSFKKHAESCPRCASHSQRLRALDFRIRSLRGAGNDDFPSDLHSKITAAVREERWALALAATSATSAAPSGVSRRPLLLAVTGVTAALALLFSTWPSQDPAPQSPALPELASSTPSPDPIPSSPDTLATPAPAPEPAPSPARSMAQLTSGLPTLLVSKVSEPYDTEFELLADDLYAATNFLSACLFVPEVRSSSGL